MTEASKNTLAALIIGGGGGGSYALNKYLKSGSEEETKGEQEPGLSLDLNSLLNADINFAAGQDSFSRGSSQPSSVNLISSGANNYGLKTLGSVRHNQIRLVDPNNPTNKEWWEWAFKKFELLKNNKTDFVHTFFSKVEQPYSTFDSVVVGSDQPTALNKACNKAYTLKYLDFEPHENLLENIKEFCSTATAAVKLIEPEDEEPNNLTTLSSLTAFPGEYSNKLASFGSNKNHFVSSTNFVEGKSNLLWWKWSYKKNFLNKKYNDPTWLTPVFSSAEKAYSDVSDAKALNQICELNYKKEERDVSDVILQSNIRLFCTKGASNSTYLQFSNLDIDKIYAGRTGIRDTEYR